MVLFFHGLIFAKAHATLKSFFLCFLSLHLSFLSFTFSALTFFSYRHIYFCYSMDFLFCVFILYYLYFLRHTTEFSSHSPFFLSLTQQFDWTIGSLREEPEITRQIRFHWKTAAPQGSCVASSRPPPPPHLRRYRLIKRSMLLEHVKFALAGEREARLIRRTEGARG